MSSPPSSCIPAQTPGEYHALPTTVEGFTEAIMKAEDSHSELRVLRDVGETVLEVKAIFERIGERLAQFDDAQFFDSRNNLMQLNWQWKEYGERFKALVGRSAYKASAVAAILLQYNKAVMTDVERADVAYLKTELLLLAKDLQKLAAKVAGIRQIASDFHTIHYDVKSFRLTIETCMNAVGQRLAEDGGFLAGCDGDISDLRRFMIQFNAQQEKQRSFPPLRSALEAHMKDLVRAAEGAELIGNVLHSLIAAEMILYHEVLQGAADPDLPVTPRTMKKIAATRPVYGRLLAMLEVYHSRTKNY